MEKKIKCQLKSVCQNENTAWCKGCTHNLNRGLINKDNYGFDNQK